MRSIEEIVDNTIAMLEKSKTDILGMEKMMQDICEDHARMKKGMKMEEALEELKVMAKGKKCAVSYAMAGNYVDPNPCDVWIQGEGNVSASTFRVALDKVREELGLDPLETQEIPDIEA